MNTIIRLTLFVTCLLFTGNLLADAPLQLSTFQIDVTPPLGSPLCNGNVKPVREITTPLTARGIVLFGSRQPIVLCAFDWVGIANESHDMMRERLATAVGTTADFVAVHTLHQHDAPGSDLATEQLLDDVGLGNKYSNPAFDRDVIDRLAIAAKDSLANKKTISHVGIGSGEVKKVASNRRILGNDGKVVIQRQSRSKNPRAQAAPEGTIDPLVRLISFWNGDQPLVVLTYYATHPQSYYGRGLVNWDFVGMARAMRQKELSDLPHVHFNGAGGNVAAGKYNDGSPEKRPLLAKRLAAGMANAWKSQTKHAIVASDVRWQIEPVSLPVRNTLNEADLRKKLTDDNETTRARLRAARDLTFVRRMIRGHRIPIGCLHVGPAKVLHMPGELFVEYQIAAQQLQPNSFIAMAAYGDYGPGYIGTEIAYSQGGYETGIVSRVAPEVEAILMTAIKKLLKDE